MPRQPDIDRPIKLTTTLPETVHTPLTIHLWSEVEGRVPKGAYQRFFLERIEEYFNQRALNLEVYGFPQGAVVRGSPETIQALEERLAG